HGTQWLYKNWNRAASPHNDGKRIAGFMFLPADNPFVSQESKEDFLSNLSGDDREHRVRWEGGFALSERIVYAEFSPEKHVVDQFWPGDDWNRYLIVDPGITTAAVLFGAIPPDSLDDGTP